MLVCWTGCDEETDLACNRIVMVPRPMLDDKAKSHPLSWLCFIRNPGSVSTGCLVKSRALTSGEILPATNANFKR